MSFLIYYDIKIKKNNKSNQFINVLTVYCFYFYTKHLSNLLLTVLTFFKLLTHENVNKCVINSYEVLILIIFFGIFCFFLNKVVVVMCQGNSNPKIQVYLHYHHNIFYYIFLLTKDLANNYIYLYFFVF